jgi:hypothetical protein
MIEARHEPSHSERRILKLEDLTYPNVNFNSLTDLVAR